MTTPSRKIIIVDDMKLNILVLNKILSRYGFETIFEMESQNVVQLACKEQPDVILLDFEMPVMNGPEVCRALKQNPQTKDIPVLFVTSHAGENEIAEAFNSGAEDYVLKPPREQEVMARLNRVFLNSDLQKKILAQFEDQAQLTRTLSHDINNLLMLVGHGIRTLGKLLENENLLQRADFQREYGRALTGAERIGGLVENIRQLQALDDQKLNLKLEKIKVRPIFEDCATIFSARSIEKKVELVIDCDPELTVLAEPNSFVNSVLNNLISNAFKFSYPGSKIILKAFPLAQGIQVEVQDFGMGMPADLLAKIFSKTEKTSRPGTEKEKGTGFGMPIVKRFVELYGGTIEISSESRENSAQSGTMVRLTLKSA